MKLIKTSTTDLKTVKHYWLTYKSSKKEKGIGSKQQRKFWNSKESSKQRIKLKMEVLHLS